VFCCNSLSNIIKEQYYLAKHANITISDSEYMPDFEREAYINLIVKDLQQEAKRNV